MRTLHARLEALTWREWLFALLSLSLLSRLVVYLALPPTEPYTSLHPSVPLYFDDLQNHFWDYIRFTASKPPMPHILNALVVKVAGARLAYESRLFLVQLSLLDITALGLIFHAAIMLRIRNTIAFTGVLLYSLTLIPFELWRGSYFYDQMTTFFTAFFAYAIVRCLLSEKRRFVLLLAISGALLVFQSAVNLPVIPMTMAILSGYKYFTGLPGKIVLRRLSAALLGIALVTAVCRLKNSGRGETTITSNEGGAALMMVVQKSLGYDTEAVRRLIQDSHVPAWYLWCYDHPSSPVDGKGVPYEGWETLARAFGICSPWTTLKDHSWPFDFTILDAYLAGTGQTEFLPTVRADMRDMQEHRHLFAGFAHEFEPRWTGVYGSVSYKVALNGLRTNPLGFLKAFKDLQFLFAHYGPYFPRTVMNEMPPGSVPAIRFFDFVTTVFGWILGVAYHGLYIFLIAASGWMIHLGRRGPQADMKLFLTGIAPALILSVPLICLSVIFSTLVGGENDRYFIQIYPYLVLLTAWAAERLVPLIKIAEQRYSAYRAGPALGS